jgi:hypothetical protein
LVSGCNEGGRKKVIERTSHRSNVLIFLVI